MKIGSGPRSTRTCGWMQGEKISECERMDWLVGSGCLLFSLFGRGFWSIHLTCLNMCLPHL
jgi:hypothetical protein